MYFGTRDHMIEILPPAVGYGNTRKGWDTRLEFLNGGVSIRHSNATHKVYEFIWKLKHRDELQPIMDYYSGLYGTGPIYFLDPFEADRNLVPVQWSAPMMGTLDAPLLVGDTPPTAAAVAVNNNNYPAQSASYGTGDKRVLYIPIPPRHTAWVGAHGPSTSVGNVQVAPAVSSLNVAPPVPLPMMSVTDTNRFSNSFSGDDWAGIEISLQDNTTYTGLMVQVLPDGKTPKTGGFISGQGHSGCSFSEAPLQTPYSAALDRVSMTASLEEVEDWL